MCVYMYVCKFYHLILVLVVQSLKSISQVDRKKMIKLTSCLTISLVLYHLKVESVVCIHQKGTTQI